VLQLIRAHGARRQGIAGVALPLWIRILAKSAWGKSPMFDGMVTQYPR
jgi:hypothetical protein